MEKEVSREIRKKLIGLTFVGIDFSNNKEFADYYNDYIDKLVGVKGKVKNYCEVRDIYSISFGDINWNFPAKLVMEQIVGFEIGDLVTLKEGSEGHNRRIYAVYDFNIKEGKVILDISSRDTYFKNHKVSLVKKITLSDITPSEDLFKDKNPFEEGDLIFHKEFGWGFIQEIYGNNKISVNFENCRFLHIIKDYKELSFKKYDTLEEVTHNREDLRGFIDASLRVKWSKRVKWLNNQIEKLSKIEVK